jgi:hypothetical protein
VPLLQRWGLTLAVVQRANDDTIITSGVSGKMWRGVLSTGSQHRAAPSRWPARARFARMVERATAYSMP